MFIELTEILRCPNDHPESYVVATPIVMDGRRIVRGVVGCPECQAEFPILDGVVYFGIGERAADPLDEVGGAAPASFPPTAGPLPARPEGSLRAPPAPAPAYDAAALAAFLNLSGPGGYAVLAGTAGRFGAALVATVPGVHFVAVNPPPGVAPSAMLSLLRSPRRLPLKSAAVRGVALGADLATAPWLVEGVRVLLPGLRLVVEDERAGSEGLTELARGAGLLVGEKRPPPG